MFIFVSLQTKKTKIGFFTVILSFPQTLGTSIRFHGKSIRNDINFGQAVASSPVPYVQTCIVSNTLLLSP